MTHASIRNSFVALSVLALAAALSLGAFATTVHADFVDFGDLGGGGGWDYGSYDIGDYDYGSYDIGAYDYGSYDIGDYDYGCDCYAPTYSYEYYDSYSPGYSYSSYTPSYSTPSYSSSRPTTFYAPSYSAPSRPVQQQQQQQQQQTASVSPINISTVNNNTNNNNNINNVNVATVSPATPQTQVQYVYPQVQSYPVYIPTYYGSNSYGYNYNNYQYQNYQQQPFCTITATTGVNGLVTLYWSSSYATSASVSPSVGSVAPNGSTSLYNYGNSVYTMTVSGPGGSNTCRTNAIAITTPTVSLTQIPYTGLDLGPIGNAVYWMSLLAFALAGAYLVVYYRGGALALTSQVIGTRVKAEVTHTTPVAAPIVKEEPKDIFASLPVMQSQSTKDTMSMARTSDGTPRIVISRG